MDGETRKQLIITERIPKCFPFVNSLKEYRYYTCTTTEHHSFFVWKKMPYCFGSQHFHIEFGVITN